MKLKMIFTIVQNEGNNPIEKYCQISLRLTFCKGKILTYQNQQKDATYLYLLCTHVYTIQ